MIYELECALENGKVIRVEDVGFENSSASEVVTFNIISYDGNPLDVSLNEKQLFQLIGVLHNIQKQIKTKK